MSKSITSKLIDQIVGILGRDILGPAGYERKGRSFSQLAGQLYKVVHIQASMLNTPDSAQFAINLNIVLPYFHEIWTNKPFPSNPASGTSILGQRLGMVMPDRSDHWWRIAPDSDIVFLAHEVASQLKTYGLPFLDRLANVDYMLAILKSGRTQDIVGSGILLAAPVVRSILLASIGQRAEAKRILTECRQSQPHVPLAQTAILIEHRLKL